MRVGRKKRWLKFWGWKQVVDLVPNGSNIAVTELNKLEYVQLISQHRMTTAIEEQIGEFKEGFHSLIPKQLISIFNDRELELLISGLPEIDLDDLQANTEYTGFTAASAVIQMFWEVVREFSREDLARFLQFCTGTTKVSAFALCPFVSLSADVDVSLGLKIRKMTRVCEAHPATTFSRKPLDQSTAHHSV